MDIIGFLIPIPAILIAMTVHEICHGLVADKCGDPTPRATGRLSFNPLRHINPIGFLALLFIGFGYANPVQVNPRNFKKPRRDMIFVALAGPMSNLIMAFFGTLLLVLYTRLIGAKITPDADSYAFHKAIALFLQSFPLINLGFFAFNMIPLPPLDGGRILFSILPLSWSAKLYRYEHVFHYIFLALIAASFIAERIPALWFLDVLSIVLGAIRAFFYNLFINFWLLFF